MYRQGDVYLIPVAEKRPNGKPVKDWILAHGEVTGHKHQIATKDRGGAELYTCGDEMLLSVTDDGGISIVHEEHATISVPKGDYKVHIQREYSPEEIRNVVD